MFANTRARRKEKGFGRSFYDCDGLYAEISGFGNTAQGDEFEGFFGVATTESETEVSTEGEGFPEEANDFSLGGDDDDLTDDRYALTPEQDAEYDDQEAAEHADDARVIAYIMRQHLQDAPPNWRPQLAFSEDPELIDEQLSEYLLEAPLMMMLGVPGYRRGDRRPPGLSDDWCFSCQTNASADDASGSSTRTTIFPSCINPACISYQPDACIEVVGQTHWAPSRPEAFEANKMTTAKPTEYFRALENGHTEKTYVILRH